jgi:hypothetical protein
MLLVADVALLPSLSWRLPGTVTGPPTLKPNSASRRRILTRSSPGNQIERRRSPIAPFARSLRSSAITAPTTRRLRGFSGTGHGVHVPFIGPLPRHPHCANRPQPEQRFPIADMSGTSRYVGMGGSSETTIAPVRPCQGRSGQRARLMAPLRWGTGDHLEAASEDEGREHDRDAVSILNRQGDLTLTPKKRPGPASDRQIIS